MEVKDEALEYGKDMLSWFFFFFISLFYKGKLCAPQTWLLSSSALGCRCFFNIPNGLVHWLKSFRVLVEGRLFIACPWCPHSLLGCDDKLRSFGLAMLRYFAFERRTLRERQRHGMRVGSSRCLVWAAHLLAGYLLYCTLYFPSHSGTISGSGPHAERWSRGP